MFMEDGHSRLELFQKLLEVLSDCKFTTGSIKRHLVIHNYTNLPSERQEWTRAETCSQQTEVKELNSLNWRSHN